MTSRRFLFVFLAGLLLMVTGFAGTFYLLDEFGLFRSKKSIRIWDDEKTAKYLFSFKYIPENFDGILIGSSVSDNIQTASIRGTRLYNLSMNGANVSELKYPTDNLLRSGQIDYLVICLHPYFTKDSGRKGHQIDASEYYGSILSFIPIRTLAVKLAKTLGLKHDIYHASEAGYSDFNMEKRDIVFADVVAKELEKFRKQPDRGLPVDETAMRELESIIELAHTRDIKVFAFYYPFFHEFYLRYEQSGVWNQYQSRMSELFSSTDTVWDMNSDEYLELSTDLASYSDGHLSDAGAIFVGEMIQQKIAAWSK